MHFTLGSYSARREMVVGYTGTLSPSSFSRRTFTPTNKHWLNWMKSSLPLVSYLFKVAPYWSVIMVLSIFLLLSNVNQPKSAVHQQPAKLFQQHWRHLKGNYDLNSTFENADRIIEQKRTSIQFHHIAPLTL
jgi:hypothetical protein